jgi:peptidoglycan hydrolase-like protein with peptidoglycan-binding domain
VLCLAAAKTVAMTGFEQIRLAPMSLPNVVVNSSKVTPAVGSSLENVTTGLVCGMQTYNKYGSRGGEVAQLQLFLRDTVDSSLPVTSYFGSRTQAAVKVFQQRNGIPATGNQYALTTARINMYVCDSASLIPAFATHGSRGDHVVAIQRILTSAGYPVRTTGYYGPQTTASVKAFQLSRGIPATGNVFARTLDALHSASVVSFVQKIATKVETVDLGFDSEKFPNVSVTSPVVSTVGEVSGGSVGVVDKANAAAAGLYDSAESYASYWLALAASLLALLGFKKNGEKSSRTEK